MELTYNGIDVSEGLIVSGTVLIMLAVYYLYKKENGLIIWVIERQYKPHRAGLKKDTRRQDWLLLMFLLAAVVIMGLKLVSPMVIISDSMKPEFQRGDMIITQSVFLTPQPGDIITFNVKNQNIEVSHRVININGGAIKTKGDNNPSADLYDTTQKNIIAKAIQINNHPLVIRGLGALFITDYSKQGVIYKFGDRFTFMQQLSATIRAWGYIITIIAILAYIFIMAGDKKYERH